MRTQVAFLCLLLAAPAGAQPQVQEQTQDHEDQDSRYYERYDSAPGEDLTLEDFLARADEAIRDRNYRAASGDHYRVQSDDPRLDAKSALSLLEAFRAHFDNFWSGRVKLAGYDRQSRVFLFYSFRKFNQTLAGDFRFDNIRPKGHYESLFDVIALHTDAGCPEELGNSLVHEAARQLCDQRLFGIEHVRAPPWLAEGLASYFGFTLQDASGSFRTGEVGGKNPLFPKEPRGRGCGEIKEAIRTAKQAFKEAEQEGESLVEELLTTGETASFYGPRAGAHYAVSWILVHYLLHGDAGVHAESFISYLESTAHGAAEPEKLLELLGMSPGELDAALEGHLKGLKVR